MLGLTAKLAGFDVESLESVLRGGSTVLATAAPQRRTSANGGVDVLEKRPYRDAQFLSIHIIYSCIP